VKIHCTYTVVCCEKQCNHYSNKDNWGVCDITEHSTSDKEVSPEKEGDISEHSTDDKAVERISYTKVVHCVMESVLMFIYGLCILMDN